MNKIFINVIFCCLLGGVITGCNKSQEDKRQQRLQEEIKEVEKAEARKKEREKKNGAW